MIVGLCSVIMTRKLLSCIINKLFVKPSDNMGSLDYIQRLETRALKAENLIAILKEEILELQRAVDFCEKNSVDVKLKKLQEFSFKNEKLKKEIEHSKIMFTEAEKKTNVFSISSVIKEKSHQNVMISKKSFASNILQNKIPNLITINSSKKEKKNDQNKEISANITNDHDIDFKRLDIRVGKIINVKKHPNADALYIESIDLGETKPRTVVSGLVKYITLEEMENRMVIALCNLKPAKMRGIISEAMVLCASTPEKVEVLSPPEGSCPGDKVIVKGYEGEPDLVLNPKKKIFEEVSLDLIVNDQKVATYRGIPFSIVGKGIVTSQTLTNVHIK